MISNTDFNNIILIKVKKYSMYRIITYCEINIKIEKRPGKLCLSKTVSFFRLVNYTHTRINSTSIYRKGEANGIIKRAKRGELRTRSIKILSARRGLSRHARPLTARRLFICSTFAFERRGEFLTGPSLCEADCLKDLKNEEGCTQRDRSQFF